MSTPRSPRYREEVNRILADIEAENNQGQKEQERETQIPEPHPQDTMQDVYFVFIRENPDLEDPQVVDSVPTAEPDTNGAHAPDLQATLKGDPQEHLRDEKRSKQIGLFTMSLLLFLCLASIALQLRLILNPSVAIITIIPKSQQITLTGTLQLGRVLNPITISQSATAQTTGKGHQNAAQAIGTITFYNGLFTSQTIAAGTILTGSDGVQVVTNQDANIPPANPPSLGNVTVSAHAIHAGSNGNIPAYDINQECCSTAIKVINTTSFSGGQDERNFQTVTKADITAATATLKTTLVQSMQGALTGQLKSDESLVTPSCITTVTPDHRPGEEATTVKVTESETCSAIAYDTQALNTRVTQLLTAQAIKKLGTGYSLLGDVQVTLNSATVTGSHPTLAFSCNGVWVYALSNQEQASLKKIIAGKTTQDALHLLQTLPGIERAATQWNENTKLPKDTRYIHLVIIAGI